MQILFVHKHRSDLSRTSWMEHLYEEQVQIEEREQMLALWAVAVVGKNM